MSPQRFILSFLAIVALFGSVPFSAYAEELHSGSWQIQKKKIHGEWSIVQKDDGAYIMLSDGFKTRGAPDLKLFLASKNPSDVNGKNATDGSAFIAKLASNKGAQS